MQKDLGAAARARGQQIVYEIRDTALHDVGTDRPSVTYVDSSGVSQRLEADVVVGCDGSLSWYAGRPAAGNAPTPTVAGRPATRRCLR